MASSGDVIESVVQQTLIEMEKRSPVLMHKLKQEDEKYNVVQQAAREAATEAVHLAKKFTEQPIDSLDKLKNHLPEERVNLIGSALSIPTFRLNIEKGDDGVHTAHFEREGQTFMASRKLESLADIDWAKIMQYGSITVEAVLLVMSAAGVSVSASSSTIERTSEEVAETLQSSSTFEKAVEAFVKAWNEAGGSSTAKAKALFFLIKDTKTAGLLWTIMKSLCSNMKWYEWLETSAKITATIIAGLATDGAALIAEIALVVLSAVDFGKKLANMTTLNGVEMK